MDIGRQCDEKELKEIMESQKVNNCCTLIYTVKYSHVKDRLFLREMKCLLG